MITSSLVVLDALLLTGWRELFEHSVAGIARFPLSMFVRRLEMLDVPYQEDSHDHNHQQGIEDIQEYLVGNEISIVALQIFNNSKDAPNPDEGAGRIQHPQVPFPGNITPNCDVGGRS